MRRGLILLSAAALLTFGISLLACRAWNPELALRVSATAVGLAWLITCAAYAMLMCANRHSAHALLAAVAAGMLLRLVCLAGALAVARFLPELSGLPLDALPAFAVVLLAATLLLMALEATLAARAQWTQSMGTQSMATQSMGTSTRETAREQGDTSGAHDDGEATTQTTDPLTSPAGRATRPPESSPEEPKEQ